jgi:PAS domain S-box-containing protein
MLRVLREIARDVARLVQPPLVQVIVLRDGAAAVTAALEGVLLASQPVRAAASALLAEHPGHEPAAALAPDGHRTRCAAPCEPALARILWPDGRKGARSVFFRIAAHGETVLLRAVVPMGAGAARLRALAAAARLASARIEAERARREAAGRSAAYRTFQESAGDAIFVVDVERGRLLEGNRRFCELTGHRPQDLRRLPLARVLEHPLHDGASLLPWLAGEPVVRDDEARLRPRRGAPIAVAITTARIELPGRAVLHVIARDVTRERRTLAELRDARDTLAALHLAGAHLLGATDEAAIYGVIARELLRLGFHCGVLAPAPDDGAALAWRFTSLTPPVQRRVERVLGRPLGAVRVLPAAAPLVRRCLERGRTLHTDRARLAVREILGGPSRLELRGLGRRLGFRRVILAPLRPDATSSAVLVVAAPRLRHSDPDAIDAFAQAASTALQKARLIAALREERARLESEVERRTRELRLAVRALEDAGRRKDNFLANVSHELRTPLVTVLGYADLLEKERLGPISPRQRTALQVITSSGRRLKGFIEELLELERHELTKGSLVCAPFDVGGVLTQAVLALAPRFAERGVRLRARVARGTPQVWGDRERVMQVIGNLLANAERYSPSGKAVRVAAARIRPGRIEVAVSDRGAGIAEEHLPHIFERLYQVRDDRSPRHKGGALGLGLAIVKSIVEAHGGTVTVRSRPGRGTTFRFSLPTVEALGEPDSAPRAAAGARKEAS